MNFDINRTQFGGKKSKREKELYATKATECVCWYIYLAQVSSRKLINFNAIRHLYDFDYYNMPEHNTSDYFPRTNETYTQRDRESEHVLQCL